MINNKNIIKLLLLFLYSCINKNYILCMQELLEVKNSVAMNNGKILPSSSNSRDEINKILILKTNKNRTIKVKNICNYCFEPLFDGKNLITQLPCDPSHMCHFDCFHKRGTEQDFLVCPGQGCKTFMSYPNYKLLNDRMNNAINSLNETSGTLENQIWMEENDLKGISICSKFLLYPIMSGMYFLAGYLVYCRVFLEK